MGPGGAMKNVGAPPQPRHPATDDVAMETNITVALPDWTGRPPPLYSAGMIRVVVVAVLVALWPSTARAERTLVLESHVGARRPEDARILGPAREELRLRGAMTEIPDGAAERLGRAGKLPEQRIAAALAAIKKGHDLWMEGDFRRAAELLAPAIADLQASPATFASKPELRSEIRRGLVALALAHHRMRAAEDATAAMAEVVRSFADQPFDRVTFGPEAHGLYQSVAATLRRSAPGKLRVSVNDDAATILVNERFAGVGAVALDGVIPGRYRVYAQKGDHPGRLHLVDVAAGGTVETMIDWKLDSRLRSGQDHVGLVFADTTEQTADEATRATQIARLLGASAVVVLRAGTEDGRRVVVGTRYSLDTAQPLRSARLLLEPTPPGKGALIALARFLLGDPPSRDLDVLAPRDATVITDEPTHRDDRGGRRRSGAWKWVALAGGAAAIGTGVYLVSIDGPIKDANGDFTPDQYDTRLPGIVSIAAGTALVATGIVLWVFERKGPSVAAAPPHMGRGIVVSFSGGF